jgi:hypothetical protein
MQKMSSQILFLAARALFSAPLATIILLVATGCQSKQENPSPETRKPIRVVAYLMSHDRTWNAAMDTLGWVGITDLNLAFLNPEPDGSFLENPDYAQLVTKAKQSSVEIFFSIGGGAPPDHLADLLKPANRETLISSII